MKRKRLTTGRRSSESAAVVKEADDGESVVPSRKEKIEGGGSYFTAPKDHLDFISTGCTTLDLALGGGWAEGRIFNVVGDKSTGKTLLCIEAAANFARKYPKGVIRYAEAESAFDLKYAEALGMPLKQVDFGKPLETVEDLFEELDKVVGQSAGRDQPTLFMLDSLDALSDRAEMGRDLDEGSYGANKAKQMSQMFRRLVSRMTKSYVTLGIVSQVRDKIGISFGRKTTRSGGRALDFYASQIVYLAHLGSEKKTISGIERPYAVKVRAKIDKNKVGMPGREAEFDILFGYGVDDVKACLTWLSEAGGLDEVGVAKANIKKYCNELMKADDAKFQSDLERIRETTKAKWMEIETGFLPKRRKYN